MKRVTIMPPVSEEIGRLCAGDRAALLNVLNKLYDDLETRPDEFRGNRSAEDPDRTFHYHSGLYLGGRWHLIRFTIDEAMSPDQFFVVGVSRI